MTKENDQQTITRRGILGGLAASAALGIAAELPSAAAAPLDAEAVRNLVVAIDDVPTAQFEWGSLKWMINAERSPGAEQTVGICQIFPGKVNPVHYHPNCEEVLYMISGRGRHSLDDESVDLTPGMAIRIPANDQPDGKRCGRQRLPTPSTDAVTLPSGKRPKVPIIPWRPLRLQRARSGPGTPRAGRPVGGRVR